MSRTDLFNECYSGEHRRLGGPEDFRRMFCDGCSTVRCSNSKVNSTSWMHRMDTQAERLLIHPKFARENDPAFLDLRQMRFDNLLQKALRVEIATQRGDWMPVTDEDVARYAALDEEVADPTRPLHFEEAPDNLDQLVEEADRLLEEELAASEAPEEEPSEEEEGEPDPLWQVFVGPSQYDVCLWEEGWTCSCKAFMFGRANPCKHIIEAQGLYQPPKVIVDPAPELPKAAPAPAGPPTPRATPHIGGNTRFPPEGIMLDGSTPPPPAPHQVADPWAPKPIRENVIKPGSKVILGKKES